MAVEVGLMDNTSLNDGNATYACIGCPPVHLFSDFIEMTYLGVVIAIGTPANIYILLKLIHELRHTPKNSVKAGFLLMKINLNISDLFILIVLALGKLTWIATYAWYGGTILCKFFNYLSMVALYISSNVIVCIALDRLRNVLGASKIRRGRSTIQPVKIMLFFAWFLASVWSLPQLHVWDTQNVFPNWPGGWIQCSDMWSIQEWTAVQNNQTDFEYDVLGKTIYDITHLLAVFWGPLIMLIALYSIIAIRLLQYSFRPTFQDSAKMSGTFASPTPSENISKSPRHSCISTGMPSMFLNGSMQSSSVRETTFFTQMEPDTEGVIRLKPHAFNPPAAASTSSNHLPLNSTDSELPNNHFVMQSNATLLQVPLTASLERRRSSLMERLMQLRGGLDRNRALRCSEDSTCGDDAAVGEHNHPTGAERETIRRRVTNRLSSIQWRRPPSSHRDKGTNSSRGPVRPRLPAWRKQLRSKVFRTTLLVVLAHVLFWLPYNFYALMKYVNADWFEHMSEHANVFKDLQILITLINPFLYGFAQ